MSNRCCLKLQRAGVVRHCNIRRPDLRAPGTALLSVPVSVFYFCEHKSNNAEILARRERRLEEMNDVSGAEEEVSSSESAVQQACR